MPPTLVILLAEDNADEADILLHGFERAGLAVPPYVCRDGREVISYLKGENRFADRSTYPFPEVLITDLKLPHLGGVQLLRWIRAECSSPGLPVVVLTSFASPEVIAELYRAGANACLHKPMDFIALEGVLRRLHAFWTACELPPRVALG